MEKKGLKSLCKYLEKKIKEEGPDFLADQLAIWSQLKAMTKELFPPLTCHYEEGKRGSSIFLMYKGGVGFVRVSWYNGEDTAYLSDLSVNENRRHCGIATMLLQAAEEAARLRGLQYMRLQVLRYTWMHLWYCDRGYHCIKDELDVATEVGTYRWLEKRLQRNFGNEIHFVTKTKQLRNQ